MEIASLFAPNVADRRLVKIPPALIKGFLRGLPTHGSLNACKAIDRFLTFYEEKIEVLENVVSEAFCELAEQNITRCRKAVKAIRMERSGQSREEILVSKFLGSIYSLFNSCYSCRPRDSPRWTISLWTPGQRPRWPSCNASSRTRDCRRSWRTYEQGCSTIYMKRIR